MTQGLDDQFEIFVKHHLFKVINLFKKTQYWLCSDLEKRKITIQHGLGMTQSTQNGIS